MARKRVLFISGSMGLGHVIRDLAISRELRRQNPQVEILWLASQPASALIENAGEKLLPESDQWADENVPVEKAARTGFRLNLLRYLFVAMGEWRHNAGIFGQIAAREQFDLIIADEAYEIAFALDKNRDQTDAHFIMIYDFFGNDAMTANPIEKLLTYMWNRRWADIQRFYSDERNTALFVGELEDVPHEKLGMFLPDHRAVAEKSFRFVGYILPFDPSRYADKAEARAKLGYGENPMVVCTIGGTAVGKDLLTLCGRSFTTTRKMIPDLQMILVCGPRLSPDSLSVPAGVQVRAYVPALYEHFAASDLAIVQAGGNTTIELTALKRPFLYFPLEGHFEQQVHVAGRLKRHRAGIKMQYTKTTPETLAETIAANIGKKVNYAPMRTDGAKNAVKIINQFL